jgi:2-dehydropantoate 2-reductase
MRADRLNILVYGAGAIGTYIGGSLALVGHQAVFLERAAVAEELRARGLRLIIGGETHHLPEPIIVDSLDAAIGENQFDVILFALKSYDTEAVAETLAQSAKSFPPVLCLQNGVDNEPILAAALGQEKVIPGTVTSSISRRGVGDILLERLRGVGISAAHNHAVTFAAAMTEAGLNPRLYPNPGAMKWSKLLTNLLTNASAAILDMTPAEVLAIPDLFNLEILQLREALKVMDAQNLPVLDLPKTPVRALAFAVRTLPSGIARPLMAQAIGKGRGGKMPSLHIDLHSGSGKSEVGNLNGAVVRHGTRLGISTPINAMLTDILQALTRNELSREKFSKKPFALLEAIFRTSP